MQVAIGLGGNLGDVPAAFAGAAEALERDYAVVASSRMYRSLPVGPRQPMFWNMAIVVEVGCALATLLEGCQQIESEAGRIRSEEQRWGPRPLDIDLLMTPGVVCRGPRLTVPHPRFHERLFALAPATELVPEWVHPTRHRTIGDLAEEMRIQNPSAVDLA